MSCVREIKLSRWGQIGSRRLDGDHRAIDDTPGHFDEHAELDLVPNTD
jgi:hypothetical protein